MAVEREDSARELRLEGVGLLAAGAVLLAALGGAFFAGRWIERREQSSRSVTAADRPGPLSQVVGAEGLEDTSEDANYFDRVEGPDKAPEPQREARPRTQEPVLVDPAGDAAGGRAPAAAEAATIHAPSAGTGTTAAAAAHEGSFYVQVFAGHDRAAATQVIERLKGQGYGVRLFADSDSGGAILRVRVGGYPSEERARVIAGNLKQSGYSDAFVTRVE